MVTYQVPYSGKPTDRHIEVVPYEDARHVVIVQVADRRGAKGLQLDRYRMDHLIAELQQARTEMGETD